MDLEGSGGGNAQEHHELEEKQRLIELIEQSSFNKVKNSR